MKSLLKIVFALIIFVGIHANAVFAEKSNSPNIVLFFVDDLGWSDVGYRSSVYETPNVDQLSKEGLNFEQAYIASPTCSPSRGTLLTGKHPVRLELVRHIPTSTRYGFDKFGRTNEKYHLLKNDPAQFPCVNWLPLEHTSYAEALKELGYYNFFVGKWHLGHEEYHPIHQGFDQQVGVTNFGHPKSYNAPFFKNTDVLADEKERYLTDKLTDESVEFIKNYDRENPFMLSFWYYSVHAPHHGRKDLVEHFEKKGLTGRKLHYAAMIKAMDESVGRVRKAIQDKGIEKETIIIFLSDQGSYFDNPPFRGGKKLETLYEGGSKVPFIFHWPGVTKAGAKNKSVVQSTDLFPTLVEIAGGDSSKHKNLDGSSLLETIKHNSQLNRGKPVFGYRAYQDLYASVRDGDWKLLAYRSGTTKLYNIAKDWTEQNEISEANPEKTKELIKKLADWEKSMGVAKYSGVQ